MANMTWEQLAAHIAVMDDSQKQGNVTVFDSNCGEFFGVRDYDITTEDDILDKNHPFLVVDV